ncbi:hypothetical protein [Fodinicurvata sp. EGI_FJ10296]|uniref:hypothetical protein n=1 Tax=Fodinicurvata sp. EGI_FJ10296 TaxID=3231908 RepID=UPI0034515490
MTTVQILALISMVALIAWNFPRMIAMSRGKPVLLYAAIWLGVIVAIAAVYQFFGADMGWR